jgi:uncharacterized phage protein (TIGR02218 family)
MSATFLNRPVFDFAWDWSKNPVQTFSYDLREILLGQAAPKAQPLAATAVTGVEFQLWLEDETNLIAFDAFIDAVKGRLTGFWLPSPFAAGELLEPIGDGLSEFYIRDRQLRDTFSDRGYLVFKGPDGALQFGRIANCVLESGRERVTLADPVVSSADGQDPQPLTRDWEVFQLLYARMATDDFTLEYKRENFAVVTIKAVELPGEYAAIETGQQPVFLYELACQGLGTWRFTNLNQDVTSNGDTFTSWPMVHGSHKQALEGGETTLRLTTVYDQASPVSKLFPYPTPKPMTVTLWEIAYAAPNARTVRFTGRVNSVKLSGAQAELECATTLAALGAQFPRFFIQNRCNYSLFSGPCAGTKGPQASQYKVEAVIDATGGRNLVLKTITPAARYGYESGGYPRDYFTFGYIEHINSATGLVDAIRTIERSLAKGSDGTMYLTLTAPLNAAETLAGDAVRLYPGCDGTRVTCADKFNNFSRWGGHNLAASNLSITAVTVPSQTGNKK